MAAEPTYQLEPELRMGTPRRTRIKPGDRGVLWGFALFTFAVAWIIGWFAARDLDDLYALRAHGITAQAIVTDKREVHGKGTTYYLSYSLRKQNIPIDDEDQVPESIYEEKNQGNFVSVTFLPDRPETHRLGRVGDERVRRHTVGWSLGWLAGTGLLGLCTVGMLYEACRELRLARSGVSVTGFVIKCVAPDKNAKTTDYTLTYRFTATAEEETRTCAVSDDIGKRLAEGQPITILCDAQDRRNARPYCALQHTEIV